MAYTTFIFEQYALDVQKHTASFTYSYDGTLQFTETLVLPKQWALEQNPLMNRLLFHLHLALGVSYWKAYCPQQIEIRSGQLTKKQATFWNTVYTKGLGEFFYENAIDFRGLVKFPFVEKIQVEPVACVVQDHALVPVGGGKDSLTTIALLQKMGMGFDTFTLNHYPIITEQVEHLHLSQTVIERHIDPQLSTLSDTYNGHVPISMIYAFSSLLAAVVGEYKHIVLSNEQSANEGNVEYLGTTINHQWSKTIEFETAFSDYVHSFITPDIHYFSLLRPLHEIQITKLFAQHYAIDVVPFTSCNKNFTQSGEAEKRWCGKCAKCAFVFTMLSPFVKKEVLVRTFQKNIFDDKKLIPLFEELTGKARMKPFDCVGTPEEVIVALVMAQEQKEYANDAIMKWFVAEIAPTIDNVKTMRHTVFSPSENHIIPEEFQSYMHGITT